MKQIDQIKIATAFKNEMAARYALPELRTAEVAVLGDEAKKNRRFEAETTVVQCSATVEPTGQLAGIINKLEVEVEVCFHPTHKQIGARLKYSYSHHSLGSNGAHQQFQIVTESRYGDDSVYAGCVSAQLAYMLRNMEREVVA